jgi:hypothetical protein
MLIIEWGMEDGRWGGWDKRLFDSTDENGREKA